MIEQVLTEEQINTVSGLAFEIWKEHYYPLLGKPQIDYMLEKFQSPEAISGQISEKDYKYCLIKFNNEYAGYTAYQVQGKTLFLSKFYIKKEYRKKGLGRMAFNYIFDEAVKLNLSKIYLTVNKFNSGSMKVYEKIGFKNSGPIVQDIGNGFVMDDFKYEITL